MQTVYGPDGEPAYQVLASHYAVPRPGDATLAAGPVPRARVQPMDPFKGLREGELIESTLRVCVAVGDRRRAHLRRVETARTLCSRPSVPVAELGEARAAGGKVGCGNCARKAGPMGRAAATRASQVAIRAIR